MLPEFIEPKQLAKEHKVLEGALALKSFKRSEGLIASDQGNLSYNWQFEIDQHDQVRARLDLNAELTLQCQRCQQPFSYHLNAHIPMRVVHTEPEAEALPLEIEPLYVDAGGQCSALEAIEDEFILNIPEFPKHEKKDCGLKQNQAYYDTPSNGAETNTYKPFANLKLLSKEKK